MYCDQLTSYFRSGVVMLWGVPRGSELGVVMESANSCTGSRSCRTSDDDLVRTPQAQAPEAK